MTNSAKALLEHQSAFGRFKRELYDLYEDEVLERRRIDRGGGWTWGYKLAGGPEEKVAGSSIGEDEIKFFYDLCLLTEPRSAYVVGHAFGFSTYAIALAAGANCRVSAIDNWTEGSDPDHLSSLADQILRRNLQVLGNVRVHTGTSPDDTPRALSRLRGKLSLVFIDAEHTIDAAYRDFEGCAEYLGQNSVCLWHDVYSIKQAFESAYDNLASTFFNQKLVLRTYGPLGIYFNTQAHPALLEYLQQNTLIWYDWERFLPVLERIDMSRKLLRLVDTPTIRMIRKLRARLRR